jgi:hypothetical protein
MRATVDGSHHGEHSVVRGISRTRAPPGHAYPPSTECRGALARASGLNAAAVGLRHARCTCLRVCSVGNACADKRRRHQPADALADDLCAAAGTDLCADAWADVIADGSRRCAPSAFDAAEHSPSGTVDTRAR